MSILSKFVEKTMGSIVTDLVSGTLEDMIDNILIKKDLFIVSGGKVYTVGVKAIADLSAGDPDPRDK